MRTLLAAVIIYVLFALLLISTIKGIDREIQLRQERLEQHLTEEQRRDIIDRAME